MIGIELITIPTLLTHIGLAACAPESAPKVNLNIVEKQIVYDVTKSHNQLEQFSIDTVSPYEAGVHSKISGLMSGDINVSMSANIAWSSHPVTKNTCMWYDTINLTITSSPTIYIAAEHNHDRCRYDATMKHEMKHVAADQAIMRKYKPIFAGKIQNVLRQNAAYGPFKKSQIESKRADMNKNIQEIVEKVLVQMKEERRIIQQRIDSKHEYDRLSRQCNGL